MAQAARAASLEQTGSAASVGWSGHVGSLGVAAPVEPVGEAAFFTLDNDRQPMGGSQADWSNVYSFDRRKAKQAAFTPLVGFLAAAFPAMQTFVDNDSIAPLFLADVQSGIAAYERDMQIVASWRDFRSDGF